jgi:hypothetical protein
MGKGSTLFLVALVALLVFGTLGLATQEPKQPAKVNKDLCLGCHGPFDKVIAKGVKFKISEEEAVNPHKYVPHDGEEVPECTECHIPHAIPLKDKSTVVKPKNVEFCFASCHHMKNFQPCKTCH